MALVDDFKARFPELVTQYGEAVVNQRIVILENVYTCYFCGDYNDKCDREAILNLLAHMLVVDQSGTTSAAGSGMGGAVSSKSVGNVSVSYGATSDQGINRDAFGSTKYGATFLLLISGRRGAYFV